MGATGHRSGTTKETSSSRLQILSTEGLAGIHSGRPVRWDQPPSKRVMDRGLEVLATPKDEPKSPEAGLGKPNFQSEAPRKPKPSPLLETRCHEATKRNSEVENAEHTLPGKAGADPGLG